MSRKGNEFESELLKRVNAMIRSFPDRDVSYWNSRAGSRTTFESLSPQRQMSGALAFYNEEFDSVEEVWSDLLGDMGGNALNLPGFGKVEFMEQYGGEGQGDDYWIIVKFTDLDGEECFFQKRGRWQSFHGLDWYEGCSHGSMEPRTILAFREG